MFDIYISAIYICLSPLYMYVHINIPGVYALLVVPLPKPMKFSLNTIFSKMKLNKLDTNIKMREIASCTARKLSFAHFRVHNLFLNRQETDHLEDKKRISCITAIVQFWKMWEIKKIISFLHLVCSIYFIDKMVWRQAGIFHINLSKNMGIKPLIVRIISLLVMQWH